MRSLLDGNWRQYGVTSGLVAARRGVAVGVVSVVVVRVPRPDLDLLGTEPVVVCVGAYSPAGTVMVVSVASAGRHPDGGGTLRVR